MCDPGTIGGLTPKQLNEVVGRLLLDSFDKLELESLITATGGAKPWERIEAMVAKVAGPSPGGGPRDMDVLGPAIRKLEQSFITCFKNTIGDSIA